MGTLGIACGGTGGHLFPGLAVAEELRASGHEVRLYISMKKIDQVALEKYPDMCAIALPSIGFPGLSPKVAVFCWKFYQAYKKCCLEIKAHHLEAVIGMGGFSCAPLLLAALKLEVPVYIHESNAFPGKVTRFLGAKVDKVFLGFEGCAKHLSKANTEYVGTPVRKQLSCLEKGVAKKHWGLNSEKITVGIMGGSQGAVGVNQTVAKALSELGAYKEQWQFIHIAGADQANLVEMNYRKSGFIAVVKDFCHEMNEFYSACDLIVARSGAASMTEIAHFGKSSVLIPYPNAAENHQLWNAKVFADKGASEIIEEGEGGGKKLADCLIKILADRSKREEMEQIACKLLVQRSPEKLIAKELGRHASNEGEKVVAEL